VAQYVPDPRNLVLVMPAAPYSCDLFVASSGYSFFQDLAAAYGDPAPPLDLESPNLHLKYATDAEWLDWNIAGIIVGSNYHIKNVERPAYPPDSTSNVTRFGDFTLETGSASFHVIAVQTTSGDLDVRNKQIAHVIDYATQHRGTEPSFVVGDFNNDQDSGDLIERAARQGNLMTCDHPCDDPKDVTFQTSKLHILQVDEPTTFKPLGSPFDPAQLANGTKSTAFMFPELSHWPVGVVFSFGPRQRFTTPCSACGDTPCRTPVTPTGVGTDVDGGVTTPNSEECENACREGSAECIAACGSPGCKEGCTERFNTCMAAC
jgi:hypothetical protein